MAALAVGAMAAPSATGPLAFVHEAMAESAPAQMVRALLSPFPFGPGEEGEDAPHQLAYGADEAVGAGGLGYLGLLAPLLDVGARVRETLAHAQNLVVSIPRRIASFVGLAGDEDEPEEEYQEQGENLFIKKKGQRHLLEIGLERSLAVRRPAVSFSKAFTKSNNFFSYYADRQYKIDL